MWKTWHFAVAIKKFTNIFTGALTLVMLHLLAASYFYGYTESYIMSNQTLAEM